MMKGLAELSDVSILIQRTREGNLEAFGDLVRRFQDMAHGYAYSILGDFGLAEDAAQEAFLEAYRRISELRSPMAFPSWFRRVVFSQCHRVLRTRSVETVPLEEGMVVAARQKDPAASAAREETRERVLEALRALPEPQRQVTALFYIDGYSQNEIAEFLEVPLTTVKKRLHDSRRKLKERMMDMVESTLKSHALPQGFADLVVRRASSEADLKGAARLMDYSARKRPEQFQSPAEAEKAGIYVVGEKGKVEGAGYFSLTEFTIGSTVLKAVRPHEMGGEGRGVPDPAFVRSFGGCFRLAKERGLSLAVVHGSLYDHAFCGFVPCFYYALATLPVQIGKDIVTSAAIREADEQETAAGRKAFQRDPYVPKLAAYIGGGDRGYVVEQGGRTVGYFTANPGFRAAKAYNMHFGYVCEVVVENREAALAAIRFAAQLAEKDGQNEVCFMYSHGTLLTQTLLGLGGKYVLRPSCNLPGLDAEMVAIIDFARLSQNLQAEFQQRVASSGAAAVDAAFSLEVAGETLGFRARDGALEILSRRQKVHRLLPRWVATRLYVGYYSGDDLLRMGPIPCDRRDGRKPDDPKLDQQELRLPEREAALFCALFPKMWPTSLPDPDVWPWVLGIPGPLYRHDDAAFMRRLKPQIDALRFPWRDH